MIPIVRNTGGEVRLVSRLDVDCNTPAAQLLAVATQKLREGDMVLFAGQWHRYTGSRFKRIKATRRLKQLAN